MPVWVYDDGGRKTAGYRGITGDCATRAIAIATGLDYQRVYEIVNEFAADERHRRGRLGFLVVTGRGSGARTGVIGQTMRAIMDHLGWTWIPTMFIGQGCKIHLRAGELPSGHLIVACSRHYVAVIDGIIHDTYDPSRNGMRCVYGYWSKS